MLSDSGKLISFSEISTKSYNTPSPALLLLHSDNCWVPVSDVQQQLPWVPGCLRYAPCEVRRITSPSESLFGFHGSEDGG